MVAQAEQWEFLASAASMSRGERGDRSLTPSPIAADGTGHLSGPRRRAAANRDDYSTRWPWIVHSSETQKPLRPPSSESVHPAPARFS